MNSNSTLRRFFAGRGVLAIFGFLVVTWFLPQMTAWFSGSVGEWLHALSLALVIPSYLLSMLLYDGSLEYLVYPIADALGVGSWLWDAGLVVVFYLFSVVAAWLGRRLAGYAARYRPADGDLRYARSGGSLDVTIRYRPRDDDGIRYALAGALVTLGVLLLVVGVASAALVPTVTTESCTGTQTASETGGAGPVTVECVRETVPNQVPPTLIGGGAIATVLGASIVVGDLALARRAGRA